MKMFKVTVSAIAGNTLEIYDMVVYGFFAAIIAQHFFPMEDKLTGIASTFAIFFIGYLARPLGALFFGWMGDNFGRKPALITSISLMAVSTCGVGLIPDYDTIGGAQLLLLNLRLLQGFSVGAESTGSIIFMIEHAPKNKRGWYGSLATACLNLGLFLASFVAWVVHHYFSDAAVQQWAWRLPFLLASLGGFLGWLARRQVPETDLFYETYQLPQSYFNTRRDFFKQLRPGLLILGMDLVSGVLYYLVYVFILTYMSDILHYTRYQALTIILISVIFLTLLRPCMGMLSDRIGRRPLLAFGLIGIVLWAWPYFWLLQQHNLALVLLAQLIITLFAAPYLGVEMVIMAEMVPVQWRFTVVSVAYAISASIFGGMTPLVATLLVKTTHSYTNLALYVVAAALISAIAVYKIRETRPHDQ